MKQYQEFVLNKLGDIDHVGAIESTFVMSEVKHGYGINI
jgi:Lrp/AsnC family leucine-responsive transcriptional regulator